MYIIKSGALYWTGNSFSPSQRDAKRLYMDRPTSTFSAYLNLVFSDSDVRFVKLTNRGSVAIDQFDDNDWR